MQTFPAIEALRGDLTYAARMMRKNPGFAAAAVLTLALGIGANTAIFSVCHAVLFKPLPYAEPRSRRDALGTAARRDAGQRGAGEFCGLARCEPVVHRDGGGERAQLHVQLHSRRTERGVAVGRRERFVEFLFRPGRPVHARPQFSSGGGPAWQHSVAVLSYATWSERFGADRDIVGKAITLDDKSYTVVGVLPAEFEFGSTRQISRRAAKPTSGFRWRSILRDCSAARMCYR